MDEFTDIPAEQGLLASLARSPGLYWDLLDLLTSEVFSHETPTWQALARALETGQSPRIPPDWLPAPDPHATVHRLVDLHQRRLLATAQERLAQIMYYGPTNKKAKLPPELLARTSSAPTALSVRNTNVPCPVSRRTAWYVSIPASSWIPTSRPQRVADPKEQTHYTGEAGGIIRLQPAVH